MAKWTFPHFEVMYTNWRGETSKRRFTFHRLWYGSTEYHEEPQWLIHGFDMDKGVYRDFAVKDMRPVDE